MRCRLGAGSVVRRIQIGLKADEAGQSLTGARKKTGDVLHEYVDRVAAAV